MAGTPPASPTVCTRNSRAAAATTRAPKRATQARPSLGRSPLDSLLGSDAHAGRRGRNGCDASSRSALRAPGERARCIWGACRHTNVPRQKRRDEWESDDKRRPTSVEMGVLSKTGLAIVLVAPRVPENVGAVCRVASNYGVSEVRVAAARCDPRGPVAARVAVVAPSFTSLSLHATLADALSDGVYAVGMSRRSGGTRVAATSPAALFSELLSLSSSPDATTPPPRLALVFGREEAGLTTDELALCAGGTLSLPHVDAGFGSLNLSHAVAVTLALAADAAAAAAGEGECAPRTPLLTDSPPLLHAPAPPATLDALIARVAALCARVGLDPAEAVAGDGNHGRKLRVPGHVRSLAVRGRATRTEVGALHALLREVEEELGGVE